ncbi:hypothetical protein [Dyadobacter jejuensis]|nr:hypothetical protein [Dyadobacter jejuensis]
MIKPQPRYNCLLFGIFISCILGTAVADILIYLGVHRLEMTYEMFLLASTVVGPICLVSVTWSLIRHKPTNPLQFWVTLLLGIGMLVTLIEFGVQYLGVIVQSFCILVVMLTSLLGLANRQKSALWIIIAMILYALTAKAGKIPLPANPKDLEHYLLALTLLSMGKAFTNEFRYLF